MQGYLVGQRCERLLSHTLGNRHADTKLPPAGPATRTLDGGLLFAGARIAPLPAPGGVGNFISIPIFLMANTPQAQSPATEDSTSSARPLHRIALGEVTVSFFPNDRATLQRRYRNKDGKTAYANSLRPEDWAVARRLLEQLEEWYASPETQQSINGAKQ